MVRLFILPLVGQLSSCFTPVYRNRRFITLPFLARDPKAIEIVQIILESILLRREKTMLDTNGKRIVELPQKEVRMPVFSYGLLTLNFLPGYCRVS